MHAFLIKRITLLLLTTTSYVVVSTFHVQAGEHTRSPIVIKQPATDKTVATKKSVAAQTKDRTSLQKLKDRLVKDKKRTFLYCLSVCAALIPGLYYFWGSVPEEEKGTGSSVQSDPGPQCKLDVGNGAHVSMPVKALEQCAVLKNMIEDCGVDPEEVAFPLQHLEKEGVQTLAELFRAGDQLTQKVAALPHDKLYAALRTTHFLDVQEDVHSALLERVVDLYKKKKINGKKLKRKLDNNEDLLGDVNKVCVVQSNGKNGIEGADLILSVNDYFEMREDFKPTHDMNPDDVDEGSQQVRRRFGLPVRELKSIRATGKQLTSLEGVEDLVEDKRNVAEMDLSGNHLRSIRQLDEYSGVGKLNLEGNRLQSVSTQNLPPRLTTLNVNDNQLTELPDDLLDHALDLQELRAWGNKITTVPEHLMRKIALESCMEKLDLSMNQLTEIPRLDSDGRTMVSCDECGRPYMTKEHVQRKWFGSHRLKELDVSGNKLTELPSWMFVEGFGPKVLKADLNQLSDLPKMPSTLPKGVEEASFVGNNFTTLPVHAFVCEPTTREQLRYGRNLSRKPQCKNRHEKLSTLSSIKQMCFDCNQIEHIPAEIGQCRKLRMLSLTHNKLKEFPASLLNCNTLGFLYLDKNLIQNFEALRNAPDDQCCNNLSILSLQANHLTEFPNFICCRFPHLRRLHLENNKITQVPNSIGLLQDLTNLHLDGNPIKQLPDCLKNIPALRKISMKNCGLTNEEKKAIQDQFRGNERITLIFD